MEKPYEITIHLNKSIENEQFPSGLVLCEVGNSKLFRTSIGTKVEYSGYVEAKIGKQIYLNSLENNKLAMNNLNKPDASIGCSFSVTTPGEFDENCGETCSETSLLEGKHCSVFVYMIVRLQ